MLDIDARTQPGYTVASGPLVTLLAHDFRGDALLFEGRSEGSTLTGVRLDNFFGFAANVIAPKAIVEDCGTSLEPACIPLVPVSVPTQAAPSAPSAPPRLPCTRARARIAALGAQTFPRVRPCLAAVGRSRS